MRVVTEADTATFTDPSGDTLTLLASVRHRDAVKRQELESREGLEGLKNLGMTMQEALALERESTPEELDAARKRRARSDGERSPSCRRFMLQAIAAGLTIDGKEVAPSAILDTYDKMDPASAAWVDAQVAGVWEAAMPGEDDRAKPDASAGIA